MVGTVPIKHIISATPCPLWKHIFGLWGKVRAKLQPTSLRNCEALVSQPVWFDKRLSLKGLKFSASHTVRAKWAPLASLDVSTFRGIMGANHKWFTPAQMAPFVHLCLPDHNNPHFLHRVKKRTRELLRALKRHEKALLRNGPTPITKGCFITTDGGVVGKVMHVGQRALSIRAHTQDPEGCLTPTTTYSAHVLERVQLLKVCHSKSGGRLLVGPAQGAPPSLSHYRVMGKSLAKCETKHFCKVLAKNPPKAQREKLAELCTFWAGYVGWGFKPSNMATLKHKGSN